MTDPMYEKFKELAAYLEVANIIPGDPTSLTVVELVTLLAFADSASEKLNFPSSEDYAGLKRIIAKARNTVHSIAQHATDNLETKESDGDLQ